MEALRIENIEKSFDGFLAVNKISFSVEKGQFLTLLGPSGCGKTTLLKLIGGFHTPNAGKVFINGEDITKDPPEKRNTTMCFQSYALFPHLTVSQNITFGLKQQKLSKNIQDDRLASVVKQVNLKSQVDKYPSMLSGGQQQRVALARALAMRSGIVLFDEPLSNLDAKLRLQVRFEITQLQKEHGFTAIYVTHDQSEALAMSDHIIVLNEGRIEQQGSPQEIYHNPTNSFIADFIGTANIFEGNVIGAEGSHGYRVQSSMGEIFVKSEKKPPAKKCLLSWRPEDAQINNPDDAANKLSAIVEASVYQGNITDIMVRNHSNKNAKFRIQTMYKADYSAGDTIQFSIKADKFKFLESLNDQPE